MKVLFITRFSPHRTGGVSTYCRELIAGLAGQGVESLVWTADDRDAQDPRVTAIRKPWEKHLGILELQPAWFDWRHVGSREAARRIEQLGVDVVHLNDIGGGWFSMQAAAEICQRVPTVWFHHDAWALANGFVVCLEGLLPCEEAVRQQSRVYQLLNYSPYHESFKSRSIKRLLDEHTPKPALHVVGSHYMADLLKRSARFDASRCRLLPLAVRPFASELSAQPREQARIALGLKPDLRTVLIAASRATDFNKGVEKAAQAVVANAGVAPIQAIVMAREAQAAAKWLGNVPTAFVTADAPEKLARAYRAADVTIVPSLMESFGYMAAESLLCHTPVVAFAVGGLIDVLGNGEHGALIPPYDTMRMAMAVQYFLNNPSSRDRCAETGRQWVLTQCDPAKLAQNMHAVYHEAIARFKVDRHKR